MARYKGSYIGTTYDTNKRFPLDARMLVSKYADLINPSIWRCSGQSSGDALFNGLLTVVLEEEYRGIYCLIDREGITYGNYTRYQEAVSSGSSVDEYFTMWEKYSSADKLLQEIELILADYATKEHVDKLLKDHELHASTEVTISNNRTLGIGEVSISKVMQDPNSDIILNGGTSAN